MIRVKIHEGDRLEALRAIQAAVKGDPVVWHEVVDAAFRRVHGVERLLLSIAEESGADKDEKVLTGDRGLAHLAHAIDEDTRERKQRGLNQWESLD